MKLFGAILGNSLLESQSWQREMAKQTKLGKSPSDKSMGNYVNLSLQKGVKMANYVDSNRINKSMKLTHPLTKKTVELK